MDLELSFTTQEDIKELIESLLKACWPHTLPTPFPRLKYHDAMQQYGIDKPDTRFAMKVQTITLFILK